MRRTLCTALSLIFLLTAAATAGAQTIRGSITDRANSRPLADVLVTILDASDKAVGAGVRTDSLGLFMAHTGRAGRYRIRASRIGYQPMTSDPIQLDLGQLVVIRLQMTTVPQQLPTVRIVERRRLHATELMTAAGFDLRQSRGIGDFMTAEQLAAHGSLSASELMRGLASNITFIRPSSNGDVLTLLNARSPNGCSPEILVDGLPVATGVPSDTLSGRGASALAALAGLAAKDLHGIEIYSFRQIPPPSIAGLLGMSQGTGALPARNQQEGLGLARNQCGVVAIWTKNGILRGAANPRALDGSRAVQVVRGTIHNFDDGTRISNATVRLIEGVDNVVGEPVTLDSLGRFTIRTTRAGTFRMEMSGPTFRTALTPPFQLVPEELVLVRLFVSAKGGVLAPMGLVGRTSPRNFAPATFAGFAYRRERGIGGTFISDTDIRRSSARTVGDLVAAPGDAACAPLWFLDGSAKPGSDGDEVAKTPLTNVIGLEIYESPRHAPEIFGASAASDCRLVLVWTTSAK